MRNEVKIDGKWREIKENEGKWRKMKEKKGKWRENGGKLRENEG